MASPRRFLSSSVGLIAVLALCAAGKADAPKVSPEYQPICAFGRDLCEAFEATRELVTLEEGAAPPRESKRVLAVLDRFTGLKESYTAAIKDGWDPKTNAAPPVKTVADPHFNKLAERVNALGLSAVPESLAEAGKVLGLLEARMDALEAKAGDAGAKESIIGELRRINEMGTGIWEQVESGSYTLARMGGVMSTNSDGSFKKLSPQGEIVTREINPIQTRLAELGARIAKLDQGFGGTLAREAVNGAPPGSGASKVAEKLDGKGLLANPFGMRAPEKTGEGAGALPEAMGLSGGSNAGGGPGARPSLIIRPTPALAEPRRKEVSWAEGVWAAVTGKRDSVYSGEEGQDLYPEETLKVEKLRARGKTWTTGDPVGRARYVYQQEGGTCSIASQGQIIAATKKLPPDSAKMRKLEDALFDRATAQKCFPQIDPFAGPRHGGSTPTHCMSRLLEEEGILVRRKFGASEEDLKTVLRTGKIFIVSLDSGILWQRGAGVFHAVTVTGGEFSSDGGLLGVYINDTGFVPPTGGRFVTAAQFGSAWRNNGSVIIEPL